MHVVATAGHVDHGKSSLVQVLTGVHPDRWEEERRRGMTIDLGFAALTLPSGAEVGFVDVPGHVRFLSNMLAGVGAVDACVFVVAATEGWKPQSEEHLRILELLGIGHGVIALTMTDLVDEDTALLTEMDVRDRVVGTFLADATIVPVSARTGHGVPSLIEALEALVATTPLAADHGRPRLWVDRCFTARGSGTVVTGTLTGGSIGVGDELAILPAGHGVRVRAIQSHDRSMDRAAPGRRVALNLAGVERSDVMRGDAVVRAEQWAPSAMVDGSLTVLPSLRHSVSRRGAFTVHIGSRESVARVRVLGTERLEPGTTGAVRLHLDAPLPLVMGDRYVLRESGRDETVGGGIIMDVRPRRPASRARPDLDIDRLIAEHGEITIDLLEQLTGARRAASVDDLVLSAERLAAHEAGEQARREAERDRAIAQHPLIELLRAGGLQPPEPLAEHRADLRELVMRGLVVERDGICFHPDAIDAATRAITPVLRANPAGATTGALREAMGTTRKFAIPLLNELDQRRITLRRGDLRMPGPRLPAS